MEHRGNMMMRWYNPALGGFEWREVPESDEEAFSALEGSPSIPRCAQTYREWRDMGAGIRAALIRAGETARGGQTPSKILLQDLQRRRRRSRDLPPPRPPTRTEGSPPPRSSQAASSTASSSAPLALKAAATEPSGLSKSNRSGSRRRRYPSGRFGFNVPSPSVRLLLA